ncbi:hypothetical protein F4861DRAFT_444798 [Xylaria intraflava]|nr:hypothetical protein F4861DRAFT_444798 [Xylaria intraflava]
MSSVPFQCGSCSKLFIAGWQARDNHLRSTGHKAPAFECDRCARCFDNGFERLKHMAAVNHFQWECAMCGETWDTEKLMTAHEQITHNYCGQCKEAFETTNEFKMHMGSASKHQDYPIKCHFCNEGHQTGTSLTAHLKSGSCPGAAGMNRQNLQQSISGKNPNGIPTNNAMVLHGSAQKEVGNDPQDSAGGTECHICHRNFASALGLQAHLKSPVHQDKLYPCPNKNCSRQFVSVGGLTSHLESQSCGGEGRTVQQDSAQIKDKNRLLEFK